MPPTQIPTVGRIVHYVHRGTGEGDFIGDPCAAIITDVREVDAPHQNIDGFGGGAHQVRLCVFTVDGLQFTDWISQGPGFGTWDWPPRV